MEKFEYSDHGIAISEIVKRINDIVGFNGRKIKRTAIVDRLMEDGYIAESEINGRKYKLPTEKGIQAGIYTEDRVSYKGSYKAVLYGRNAQRIIIDYLGSFTGGEDSVQPAEKSRQAGSNRGKPWDGKQEEELTAMFKDGLTVKEMAKTLQRSSGGIRARLVKLGLITDENGAL